MRVMELDERRLGVTIKKEGIMIRVTLRTLLATVVTGAMAAAQVPENQQVPDAVFRSQTELVTVTATVTDRQGRPVTHLRKEDFTVAEDNVPQEIAFFAHDMDTPISVVVLVDVSGSMVDKMDDVRDALQHFIAGLREEDEIALIEFSTGVDVTVPFGSPRSRLTRGLNRLFPSGGTALYDATIDALDEFAKATHRKKVLLLVTDGNDTDSRASRRDAVTAATRSEALVYALGIGHGARGSFGHGASGHGVLGMQRDTVDIGVLRALAEPSGGRAELIEEAHRRGVDLLDQAITEFGRELRQQYSIGYYPSRPAGASETRRIRVTTTSRDYTVRSRTGLRRDASGRP
jgi:Ca-activated chloride channel family protein